jgi:hydrogenase nickel incorporation protein HypB
MPYTNFNREQFFQDLANINPNLPIIETACIKGEGLQQWMEWIQKEMAIIKNK